MERSAEVEAVYGELKQIAAIHLSRSVRKPSLQATQLVHEAWVRLAHRGWRSRTHFLALASRTMRLLLIDALRAKMADRRGGGETPLSLSDGAEFCGPAGVMPMERVIDIDRALDELSAKDERKAQVVEMRFFGGLELQEIAEALDISIATVKRDWEFARTWLYTRLSEN